MHLPKRRPLPHNPLPESPYEVLTLFTGAMVGASLFLMATGALMSFFKSALNLDQAQLGLILSTELIGSVAMTSVAGLLTDRFGDKRVVLWSGMLMGVALIAAALIENFTWLLAWLFVYGIGYAAVTPAGCHAIIFFFKKSARGVAMGVRQCGVPIAGVIGSLLLPAVATRFEYRGALVAAGVLTLIAGGIASSLYREPSELQGERVSIGTMLLEMLEIARESRLILLTLTSMILAAGQFALIGYLALTFSHAAGFGVPLSVALFTISQSAAIAGRLAWGWISDRVFDGNRALPLAVVCLVVALLALAMADVGTHTAVWTAVLVSAALGFAAEGWIGVSVIGFAEIGGEEHSGSALGVGLTWTLAAAMLTPAIFGAVVQTHGFSVAWRWLALIQALGIVPALLAGTAVLGNLSRKGAA
ncbi:MAG TPA: MFS transporter [Candidatus Cybelea sp.]|jgi:MFS family permease